jgi:hypothetical protein
MSKKDFVAVSLCLVLAAGSLQAVDVKKVADVKVVPVPQLSGFTLNPTSVVGGGTVVGTVTLSAAAGSAGVTVKIGSSAPSIAAVPASVVVQPGVASATFLIQTAPVTVNPNVVADAPSSAISVQTGTSAPSVVKLTVFPPKLSALTINPASVPGGTAATGQVTITGAAPPAGVVIGLSMPTTRANTPIQRQPIAYLHISGGPVSIPAQVAIPGGALSATFTINTKPVAAATTYQIDAAQGVFITKSATLTLQPPMLDSISVSPTTPIGGTAVTATVKITAPAPQEGLLYAVHIGANFFCGTVPTVPPTVQIPGGATSATFPITTYPGFGNPSVGVSGPGQSKAVDFGVRDPVIDQSSLQFPSSVKGGTTVQAKLHLNGAAAPLNCVNGYKLQSSNATLGKVPDSVIVTPGQTDAPFSITTSAVPSAQNVVITVFGNVGYGYASVQKTLTLTP